MSEYVNQPAEEDLLGAMLLSGKAIDAVIGRVEQSDFFYEKHGLMFMSMVEMHMKEEPVDPVTLAHTLERIGKLDACGGHGKLVELAESTGSTSQAQRYADIVSEQAMLRRLSDAGMQITQMVAEKDGTGADMKIAQAEMILSEAALRHSGQTVGSITDGFEELLDDIRKAYQTKEPITGKHTGVTALDVALNGFWPGQLILAAARPGVGKSALAQNIAENLVDRGERVLFVTLEMSVYDLQIRGLSRAAQIDGQLVANGQLPEDKLDSFRRAKETILARRERFFVDDGGMATVPALVAQATRLHRQGGLGLVVVDYLQLMQGVGKTKTEEIGYISRNLKLLARRLNVPILALSQMNRNIISRADKRPDLSDLRDSGSLEQDADVVVFLHRDSDYDSKMESDGTIELIVAKNRKGHLGTHKALFTGRFSSFLNTTVPSS